MKRNSTADTASILLKNNTEPKPDADSVDVYHKFKQSVLLALQTYSNVHRGSGQFSLVTTSLYEKARKVVLKHLGFSKRKYIVVFTTPMGSDIISGQLPNSDIYCLQSSSFGLPLGVVAMVIKKKALSKKLFFHTGGGTARLISPDWVVWSRIPDRFEAGTPSIINIIAFVSALSLIRKCGHSIFITGKSESSSVDDILYRDELDHLSGKGLLDALRNQLIGLNTAVPVSGGEKFFVNLDNAASTPTFKPIFETVFNTWKQAESEYPYLIEEVMKICANVFGAPKDDYDIIFTSNTTEAINLAAESFMGDKTKQEETIILTSFMEHSSNDLPWRMASGANMLRLSVDSEGFLNLDEMKNIMAQYNFHRQHGNKRIKLVALSGASNVLTVYNNLPEISRIAHQYGARFLVDAAQMTAHHEIDMADSGIDYLAFSAHKVYAPFGSGALIYRKNMLSFSRSGAELIKKSGNENVGGIAALGKSLVLLKRIGFDVIRQEEQFLTVKALKGLVEIPGLNLYGLKDPDSPAFKFKGGIILFNLKGMMADRLAKELAMRGAVGIRSGCHCAHIIVKQILGVSPFLEKFQRMMVSILPAIELPGVARASIGLENTEKDIDRLVETLKDIAGKKNSKASEAKFKQRLKEFVDQASSSVYSNPGISLKKEDDII